MRPLQLSFSGMRSYAGACGPLDFTGKSMIGILGDTGAGKSTILEAITFALYGNSSWSGSAVAPLVADGATAMSVDLTFVHDRQRWRVRRIFHTGTTPTSHLLENLDTGEKVDNARSVNRRIASLLNLSFDGFQAAVLLPQGRFDQLLNASGRDRTVLLKGIFGAQVIETMRERATEHRERLTDLLSEARLARGVLLPDPEAAALTAELAAGQAERRTTRLAETLNRLRDIQREAARMRDGREDLVSALAELDRRRIGDAAEIIAEVKPVELQLAQQATTLVTRQQASATRLSEAKDLLAAAEARGETPSSLTVAEAVLSGVPARLNGLAEERAALAQEDQRLVEQNDRLVAMDDELAEARTVAAELGAVSDAATETMTQARESVRLLRDSVGTTLGEAVALARGLREEATAEQEVSSCRDALPPRGTALEEAESALAAADERLEAVQCREAAHMVGAHLSGGDPCPVCARPVPGDYRVPDAFDPQALQTAQRAKQTAVDENRGATNALSRAKAELATAVTASTQRHQATDDARARLDQAREAARQAAHGATWPRSDTPPSWDRSAFVSALDTAITTLSAGDLAGSERLRAETLTVLLEPAEALERALVQSEESARTAAITAESEAESLERSLHALQESHEQATEQATRAKRRHGDTEERLRNDLHDLPGVALDALPTDHIRLTAGDIPRAQRLVSGRHAELNALVGDLDQANAELTDVAEQLRALDQRRLTQVTNPLRSVLTRLHRWTEAIQDAAQRTGRRYSRPAVPEDPTTETVTRYADVVTQSAATMHADLRTVLQEVTAQADELVTELRTRASTIRDDEAETSEAIPLPEDVDSLDAAFLDPIKDAATTARNEAHRLRADQAEAEGQIERARTLDAAISAGAARHAAVHRLRALLADAKFQQYLIDQRTTALLGLASDLFGELSGGQFGFGPDFQIVSRSSNASRSPKTLSGGETFLASLALALALVDLYSRAGARLGALFLDEGFGSLDVDTLARALAVLRSETGGDKLVTVISHLHAVAEAVEDVLWVERRPAGSVARWLDADERDVLVREDISAGLLSLT
jgi:exonuclease SbcC